MTPQEIFDKAYIGVVAQGRKSEKPSGVCWYLTEDGLKCGVGHHLDAETAKVWDKYDDTSVDVIVNKDRPEAKVPEWMKHSLNLDLLTSIQRAHDKTAQYETDKEFVSQFKKNMKLVAKKFKLVVPK